MWSDCCCYIPSATPHAKTCACVCARTPPSIHFWRPPTSWNQTSSPAPLACSQPARGPRQMRAQTGERLRCWRTAPPWPHAALRRNSRESPPRSPPSACKTKLTSSHLTSSRRSQGVSPWVHTTEPKGSPKCAGSSTSHSGCSTMYTSELLSSQSRSSAGKVRSS